jgi:hypothetical protein
VSSLVTDLGLRAETTHRGTARDYIMRNGVVARRPTGVIQVLGCPLLSAWAKLRWLAEPLACLRPLSRRRRLRRPGEARHGHGDGHLETAEAFLTRHFGREATDVLYAPPLLRSHGADASALSARLALPDAWAAERTCGSLALHAAVVAPFLFMWRRLTPPPPPLPFRSPGRRRRLRPEHHRDTPTRLRALELPLRAPRGTGESLTFLRGLQTLPDALAARIGAAHVAEGAAVTALEYVDGGGGGGGGGYDDADGLGGGGVGDGVWRVHSKASERAPRDANRRLGERYDAVVMALPAHALKKVKVHVRGHRLPSQLLDPAVEYVPLAVLLLAFPTHDHNALRAEVRNTGALHGGSLLVPASEALATSENRHRMRMLTTTFSSDEVPYRAPKGCHVAKALLGGTRDAVVARRGRGELQVSDTFRPRNISWPSCLDQQRKGLADSCGELAMERTGG